MAVDDRALRRGGPHPAHGVAGLDMKPDFAVNGSSTRAGAAGQIDRAPDNLSAGSLSSPGPRLAPSLSRRTRRPRPSVPRYRNATHSAVLPWADGRRHRPDDAHVEPSEVDVGRLAIASVGLLTTGSPRKRAHDSRLEAAEPRHRSRLATCARNTIAAADAPHPEMAASPLKQPHAAVALRCCNRRKGAVFRSRS